MHDRRTNAQNPAAGTLSGPESCVASYLRWLGGGAGREPLFPLRPWPFLIASPLMRLAMHVGYLQPGAPCRFCRQG